MSTNEREAFIAQLVRALPDFPAPLIVRNARLIIRHAVTHGHLAEQSCNGHPAQGSPSMDVATVNRLQEKWDARIAKREAQIERRIAELCAEIGIAVHFGGDPRGYTVKVQLPNGASNTWGRDGWGVPQ